MSGGGGGSGNDNGGSDMQVSGMEAATSKEKGISTHAESRTGAESTSGGSGDHRTGPTGPDTSTVGSVENFRTNPNTGQVISGAYSDEEIEKGYTDQGEKLSNGNGTPMTKSQMYSTGMIEKDMVDGVQSGEDVQGRYTVNPNTGEFERTDMSFSDHWKNAPSALKMSPTLRFLYASGKNVGEWANKKGFKGYNEAGKRPNDFWGNFGEGSTGSKTEPTTFGNGDGNERNMMNALAPEALKFSPTLRFLYSSGKNVGEWASKKGFQGYNKWGETNNTTTTTQTPNFTNSNGNGNERDMMNALAPEAPYIVSGITPPTSSPASNWYANLGTTNTNQHSTDIATQYAAAKTAVSKTLQNKGPIGMLAVNQSPFYDWLKTNKIDKGIL